MEPDVEKLIDIIVNELKSIDTENKTEVSALRERVTTLEERTRQTEEDVGLLIRIVKDGNGRKPLILEVALLSKEQEDIKERLGTLVDSLSDSEKEGSAITIEKLKGEAEIRKEATKQKYTLWGAIALSVLSFFYNVISTLITG